MTDNLVERLLARADILDDQDYSRYVAADAELDRQAASALRAATALGAGEPGVKLGYVNLYMVDGEHELGGVDIYPEPEPYLGDFADNFVNFVGVGVVYSQAALPALAAPPAAGTAEPDIGSEEWFDVSDDTAVITEASRLMGVAADLLDRIDFGHDIRTAARAFASGVGFASPPAPAVTEGVRTGPWKMSINYGPDGEENWANVSDQNGSLVGNLRTHHAMAIVEAFAALSAPPAPGVDAGTAKRWPRKGDRMRFLNQNGYDHDRIDALKVMKEGDVLTVKSIDVGEWHHTIEFEEVGGRHNGVMFVLLPKGESK